MAGGYVIHVGHYSPQPVIIAHPDKNGNPTPGGEHFESNRTVGKFNMVNRATVWGRRVLPDGTPFKNEKGVEMPLETTNPRYSGIVEFLPWGTNKPGAQALEIRFLRRSSSLDYEYQRSVQKIETRLEDGTEFIELDPGENKFDEVRDALFVSFLKVYPQNRDSVSKNPDPQMKGYTYFEVTEKNDDRISVQKRESALDAGIFLKGISDNDVNLRNVAKVLLGYGVNLGEQFDADLSTDLSVYTSLLDYADRHAGEFHANVDRYKREVQDYFLKAESFKLLDIQGSKVVVLDSGKPVICYSELEGKGKEVIEDILNRWYEPGIMEATNKFKSLVDKNAK